jgi:hypothetical protein
MKKKATSARIVTQAFATLAALRALPAGTSDPTYAEGYRMGALGAMLDLEIWAIAHGQRRLRDGLASERAEWSTYRRPGRPGQ